MWAEATVKKFKRTKILATLGPASNSPETVSALIKAGANGFRMNFSHSSHAEHKQRIEWVREASKKAEKPVAILQDLQGPKIRLGELEQPIEVSNGDILHLSYKGKSEGLIPTQYDLSTKVKTGDRLLINDGKIQTKVTSVKDGIVSVEVEHGGWLMSRKGINLPDTNLKGDILTDKDRDDIRFGVENDIDYVALSFVQTADDVKHLRAYLKRYKSEARIIAKIETRVATENLEEIVKESDGVMVARGDLAIETEPEAVPIIQRKIIGLCQQYGKLSIVATQMLASMVDAPEPTRAEVSDVATAVIVGADAVMLSEETASGDFPEESVKFMKRIIRYTEENSPLKPVFFKPEDTSIGSSIASAVMTLAHQVGASALVIETASGQTARSIASHRPSMPIIMVTHKRRVAQQLALVYGGKSFLRRAGKGAGEKMTSWLKKQKVLEKGDLVVITSGKYPSKVGGTDTIKVRKIS